MGAVVNAFFGPRWNAPIVDPPAQQVPTPVGERCYSCEEPIVAGEQGLVMPMLHALDQPPSLGYIHLECHLQGMIGHMVGCCGCFPWEGTRRELALEAERRWMRRVPEAPS